MHEISISGDFSGVDFVSVSDVISACDFNDKIFSLTTVAVEVLLQMYSYVYSLTSAISVHVLVAVFGY